MTSILVIDDDPITTTFIKSIVDPGWKVLSATDGVKGLDILRKNPHTDLVVLDIQMPGMNGYRTAAQIRCISKQIRIVPYTVIDPIREDPNLEAYMSELGCSPILRKGISPIALYQHLQEALRTTPQIKQSAILIQLQRETSEREREIRIQQLQHHIMLYTTSPVAQQGIKTLIESTGIETHVHIIPSIQQLKEYACDEFPRILVATTNEYHTVFSFLKNGAIIIADSINEAIHITTHIEMKRHPLCFSVLVANESIVTKLSKAISIVREGKRFIDPDIRQTDQDSEKLIGEQLQQHFGLEYITKDELILIQMQMSHAATSDIAQKLGTSTNNVYQLRSRLIKRAGVQNMTDLLQILTIK
ncbi:MAG: response regulator [Chloroflexota bacterium]